MNDTKPCNQCPFRKVAIVGYLGDAPYDPVAFLNSYGCGEGHLPCHMEVDWEKPGDVQERAMNARPCRGAITMLVNQSKVPRAREIALRVLGGESDNQIMGSMREFCEYHRPGCRVMFFGDIAAYVEGGPDE